MSTIFKKIIDKEIPANIVYEDEEFLAFHDINPAAKVHVLVIPKKEIKNLDTATEEDALLLGKLQLAVAKVARILELDKDGYAKGKRPPGLEDEWMDKNGFNKKGIYIKGY